MPSDEPNRPQKAAIEQLEALGLSTYAARTFVGLVELGEATARDVSDVADVPRTRVYDAVEELRNRGLVDVQNSTPKRFWAISTESSGRHFEQEYNRRVNTLVESLEALESAPTVDEQRGVWTVTGHDTVSERVGEFIESANEEVVYMTVADLLTDDITSQLRVASEDGVNIRLAEMSRPVEREIREEIPNVQTFDSLWNWEDTPAGRLLMVDQKKTLVSVLVPGTGEITNEPDETAIWGTGETNGLVVVLKAMFTWQLGDKQEE